MYLIIISAVLIGIFTYIYNKLHNRNKYFEEYGIPYLPPTKLFGNLKDIILFKKDPTQAFGDLYNHKIAKDEPFVGMFIFHKPALLIRDPELIKQIFIKDFNYFYNRGATADPHFDALGAYNLFFIKNPEWKILRNSLSTFFSSGKLKQMFPLIREAASEVDSYFCSISDKKPSNWKGIEFKDICARYTTDVIASVAFGVSANSIKNPDAEFRKHGNDIMKFTWRRAFEFTSVFLMPEIVPYLKCSIFDKKSSEFLRSAVSFVMEEREKTGKKRNDLIDILIELKNSPQPNSAFKFEGDVLIAQAAIFFLAGFETSSAAISFALYELAKNPKIQKRLRQEIKISLEKYKGEISYDSIYEMEYLNALVYETTRLYPTIPFLDRQCSPPEGEEGYSLKPFSDFVVPKGMVIYTPVYPIHRDPKYYPNPEVFNPERFLNENKANHTPYTLLGFGIGPHNCVGERLGLLQVKLGLFNVLRSHYVTLTENTPKKLEFDKKAFNLQVLGGLYLDIVKDPLYFK